MAKIEIDKTGPKKGPSLSGVLQMYARDGVAVVAAWPRKRGKPKTQEHKDRVSFFKKANKLAKRSWDRYIWTVRLAVEHTPYMPRDLFLSLMAGRMFAVQYPDGRLYRSRRALLQLSKVLDIITQVEGQILQRTALGWRGVDLPAPPTAGGQWYAAFNSNWYLGTSTLNHFAWNGERVQVNAPITITRVMARFSWIAGGTFKAAIYKLSATNVIDEITISEAFNPTVSKVENWTWELAYTLEPGVTYALMVGRTDAGDAHAMSICTNTGVQWIWDGIHVGGARIAKAVPVVTDTVDIGSNWAIPFAMLGAFDYT